MLIELDLKQAKTLKITVNQFILIKFLIEQIDIKSFVDVIPINENDIKNLIDQNIITNDSVYEPRNLSKIVFTEEFQSKLSGRDYFKEFYDLYPVSIKRPDGTKDYLRGDLSRCRMIYNKVVGRSLSKHEHIMTCLKFDINTRTKANSMGYMKRMPKWLAAEEWLIYEESLLEKSTSKKVEEVYGTAIE